MTNVQTSSRQQSPSEGEKWGILDILLIEDKLIDAAIVRAMLADELGPRQRCTWAKTLADGSVQLAHLTPSCVLLDLDLPDADGLESLRKLRAVAPDVAIIVLTGLNDDQVGWSAVDNGAQDYLVKGRSDAAMLVRAIRYAIARKQSEIALRESSKRFQTLAASSPIGIFSIDSDGTASYRNPMFFEITGTTPETDISPSAWATFLHPDDFDRAIVAFDRLMRERTEFAIECRIVRPDGEYRWIGVDIAPVEEGDSSVSFVGTMYDLTKEKVIAQEREEILERMRTAERLESHGHLKAGIGHDFNNLLAIMLNYAGFVSRGLTDLEDPSENRAHVEALQKDVATIVSAVERASDLVRRITIFGQGDVQRMELIDGNHFVRETQSLFERTIGENIQLESRLDPRLGHLCSDRSRLEQVRVNPIVNARDAVGPARTIRVETSKVEIDERHAQRDPDAREGRFYRQTVSDNGCGRTPETQSRAFEPLYTTKLVGKGSGLCPATVYGVARQLGGQVEIDSEVGRGSTISVYFPFRECEPADAQESLGEVPPGRGETILLVEDDETIRDLVGRLISLSGYKVVIAENGPEALALLTDNAQHFDLLLTDIAMPQMSGYDLVEQAIGYQPDLKVLFMSGYGGHSNPNDVKGLSKFDVIAKPFTLKELKRQISIGLVAS